MEQFEQPRKSTDVFEVSRKSTDRREKPRLSTDRPQKLKNLSNNADKLEKLRVTFDHMDRSRRSVDCLEKSRKSIDHQLEKARKSVDRLERIRTWDSWFNQIMYSWMDLLWDFFPSLNWPTWYCNMAYDNRYDDKYWYQGKGLVFTLAFTFHYVLSPLVPSTCFFVFTLWFIRKKRPWLIE